MLKIKDATGETIGTLEDDGNAPVMHKENCPARQGKLINCTCAEEQELQKTRRGEQNATMGRNEQSSRTGNKTEG